MTTVLIVSNVIAIFAIAYVAILLRQSISFHKKLASYLQYDESFKKCVADTGIWYVQSVKYILIAMCRDIDCMKNEAIKEERYEDAQRCQTAITEMNKLINS